MPKLTHFNDHGEAHMVNIKDKSATHRFAVAIGDISMQEETLALIEAGGHRKGDVFGIARIAGIWGQKKPPILYHFVTHFRLPILILISPLMKKKHQSVVILMLKPRVKQE